MLEHDELLKERALNQVFFRYEEPVMSPTLFPTYKKVRLCVRAFVLHVCTCVCGGVSWCCVEEKHHVLCLCACARLCVDPQPRPRQDD